MKSITVPLERGPLSEVDLVAVGSRSGWLWRNDDRCLAGVGLVEELAVHRPHGGADATARLRELTGTNALADVPGTGPVALGGLPFDPGRAGSMYVPRVLVGDDGERRWMTSFGTTEAEADAEIRELLNRGPTPAEGALRFRTSRSPAEWMRRVGAVRDRIERGELRKAVIARELIVQGGGPLDPGELVRHLSVHFPHATVFSIDGFCGASPERLVSRFDRVVRAQPLAGTAARASDPDEDASQILELRSSAKDQTEHRITIEWLLEELLPFCSYIDAEPEPSVLSMNNVHHLATTVEGVLSEPAAPVLDLVGAVHPTPALGGDPQDLALDIIAEVEEVDRERYGGPVGCIDGSGNGDFVVGIRSAQFEREEIRIWAGVGVVGQSDPAAELAETQAKFAAILGSLLA